jgi:hypothetical protein
MIVKEKTKILYSRNGIRIVKTENLQTSKIITLRETTRTERLEKIYEIPSKYRNEYIDVKHESPLGFYYTTRERKYDIYNKKPKSARYVKYTIIIDTIKYELEYPIAYFDKDDEQQIDVEMRPWDILPGYKGMPDNMINVLVKEANNFIDLIYEYKKSLNLKNGPDEYKKKIMTDLFGYPDGPKIQSNDIKILSHGFDLKTSFRKRKEK